ncbi:MAG: GNAT family N-acetyltransferase [Acidimicrobiales bacterium]
MEYALYARTHLDGIIALCKAEGWTSLPANVARAHRVLTAPGVTTVVALDDGAVAGFCYLQSDGEIQAHLSNLVVARARRRRGIGSRLLQLGLEEAGGLRIDLVTEDREDFYSALGHRRMAGFRIYPPFA